MHNSEILRIRPAPNLTVTVFKGTESYGHISEIKEFSDALKHTDITSAEEYRDFLADGYLTILKRGKDIQGYVILSFSLPPTGNDFFKKSDAYLFHIYLAKDVRGQGLGTWLLHEAELEAVDRGRSRMFVETHVSNKGMQSLLRREGYVEFETRDYRDQYKNPNALYVLFKKELTSS